MLSFDTVMIHQVSTWVAIILGLSLVIFAIYKIYKHIRYLRIKRRVDKMLEETFKRYDEEVSKLNKEDPYQKGDDRP